MIFKKKEKIDVSAIIGKGVECKGGFKAAGAARIDGTVYGNVEVGGRLIVGSYGVVYGDVHAKSLLLGGVIYGNVTAPEKTDLVSGSKLIGDLSSKVLVVDENATFQGYCNMYYQNADKTEIAQTSGPAQKVEKAAETNAGQEKTTANPEKQDDSKTLESRTTSETETKAGIDKKAVEENTETEMKPETVTGSTTKPQSEPAKPEAAEKTEENVSKPVTPKKKVSAKSAFFAAMKEMQEREAQEREALKVETFKEDTLKAAKQEDLRKDSEEEAVDNKEN